MGFLVNDAAAKFTPIESLCDQRYTAVHTSGVRKPSDIKWGILHCTQGDTAESAARYFTSPASGGSAHLVVDDNVCFRCLRNIDIPWGAPGANTNGFHVEMAGYAEWTATQWRQHDWTIRRAAYKMAVHAVAFGFPLKWLTVNQLRAGKPGLATHADVSQAFPGSTHWDPGKNFPKTLFLRYAKEYAAQMGEV